MTLDELTHEQMEDDLDALCRLLVESHPDPFAGSGGPLNFYRQADAIARALPDRLTVPEYLRRVRPLVAAVHDGHTTIGSRAASRLPRSMGLEFSVLEDGLFVLRAHRTDLRGLIGSRLQAINDMPVERLAATVNTLWGCDNHLQVWCRLMDAMQDPAHLAVVLGQPADRPVTLSLRDATGSVQVVPVTWEEREERQEGSGNSAPSSVDLPSIDATHMGWGFSGPSRQTVILRIGQLMRYREAAEVWWHSGYQAALRDWYGEIHPGGSPTQSDLEGFVSSAPAATPMLVECLQSMAEARTPWLVVDLTESTGGNSVIANMLGWAVYGREALMAIDGGYQVSRYSPLYAENYGSIPPGNWGPGGYDFHEERAWHARESQRDAPVPETDAEAWLDQVPTFRDAVKDLPHWRPRVVAVTGARTYSAGFDILLTLKALGAYHVGVPSSQAPNCFIDTLRFTLPHSRLTGGISFKRSLALPRLDPEVRHLAPDRPLTYDAGVSV